MIAEASDCSLGVAALLFWRFLAFPFFAGSLESADTGPRLLVLLELFVLLMLLGVEPDCVWGFPASSPFLPPFDLDLLPLDSCGGGDVIRAEDSSASLFPCCFFFLFLFDVASWAGCVASVPLATNVSSAVGFCFLGFFFDVFWDCCPKELASSLRVRDGADDWSGLALLLTCFFFLFLPFPREATVSWSVEVSAVLPRPLLDKLVGLVTI